MKGILFIVKQDPDGGFVAQAEHESIFTQADDMKSLKVMARDAVICHFLNEQDRPKQSLLDCLSHGSWQLQAEAT